MENSTNVHSLFKKSNYPELNDSELFDQTGIQQYQVLIGSLQWAISLGRFDIAITVMTISSFCAILKHEHLDFLQCICGYLTKMKHARI